jgi:hypothetical protein
VLSYVIKIRYNSIKDGIVILDIRGVDIRGVRVYWTFLTVSISISRIC